LAPSPEAPADGGPDIESRVSAWWMRSCATPTFFHVAPTREYTFEAAGADTRRTGEVGTCVFRVGLVTPHPNNNTVVGRWFPARPKRLSTRKRMRSATRGRAVVVLPQWNSDAEGHVGLSRLLARFGVSALRLSLPYHDARMPPELSRADYIVSANVVRTVQVCRQAVLDARRAVAWLEGPRIRADRHSGHQSGSCLALLTAAHEPRIRAAALIPRVALVCRRGLARLSTRHVRAGLDGHIDLERLRNLWRPINPFSYLDRIRIHARFSCTRGTTSPFQSISHGCWSMNSKGGASLTKWWCCRAGITAAVRRHSSS